jgi:RimJ/RimL family protein N-acetyltransferase
MKQLDLFVGEKVKLVPFDLEKELHYWEEWDQDSEYKRLLDDSPVRQMAGSLAKEHFEESNGSGALFMVHTMADDQVIGFIELDGFDWAARSGWVGIGIGNPDYRGKGYGTEAMKLLLAYAFSGLNLNRVNLNVFSYNERAIRSYEKCGFKYEGTQREVIYKEDQRWDMIDMGILRNEWELYRKMPAE